MGAQPRTRVAVGRALDGVRLRPPAQGRRPQRQPLKTVRTIVVPVVNVDGFEVSRQAAPLGDFSDFDYEMKRKNCSISSKTPAGQIPGPCANNLAGRLRGTDLNRNYPGFGNQAAGVGR